MTSQDDAQFADIDRYIRLQVGEAAAQLAARSDTQATLLRVLRASGRSSEHDDDTDAIANE
jgi:alkylated DNA nucleotide flippase Atl1